MFLRSHRGAMVIYRSLFQIPTKKKKTDIVLEKGQQQLRQGIETFDPNSLKHAETQEKNPLPTKEGITLHICLKSLIK